MRRAATYGLSNLKRNEEIMTEVKILQITELIVQCRRNLQGARWQDEFWRDNPPPPIPYHVQLSWAELGYFTTDSQSVSPSWPWAPSVSPDQILVVVTQLRNWCHGASSPKGGRVCFLYSTFYWSPTTTEQKTVVLLLCCQGHPVPSTLMFWVV
jgi:hypothetical protein